MRQPYAGIVRASLIAGMAGVLAACSGGTYFWNESNSSSIELARTKERCAATSRDYGFTTLDNATGGLERPSLPGGLSTGNSAARRQADLYRLCMNEQGYAKNTPEDDEAQ